MKQVKKETCDMFRVSTLGSTHPQNPILQAPPPLPLSSP